MKKIEKQEPIISHVVSLVLGIESILAFLFWYISLPSGIVSIILGIKSYKKYGKKLGLAGMITGIVGISLCLLIYITLIIIVFIQNRGYF